MQWMGCKLIYCLDGRIFSASFWMDYCKSSMSLSKTKFILLAFPKFYHITNQNIAQMGCLPQMHCQLVQKLYLWVLKTNFPNLTDVWPLSFGLFLLHFQRWKRRLLKKIWPPNGGLTCNKERELTRTLIIWPLWLATLHNMKLFILPGIMIIIVLFICNLYCANIIVISVFCCNFKSVVG